MKDDLRNPSPPVRDWLIRRRDFATVILTAALLAFGVNVLAAAIAATFGRLDSQAMLWIIGIAVSVVAIFLLARLFFSTRQISREFQAFLLLSHDESELVGVDGYEFSQEVARSLEAAITENGALRKIWQTGQLRDVNKQSRARELLQEAIEYAVLEELSSHLSGYFQHRPDDDKLVQKYLRKDVPELLLRNRVLSIISESPENREHFMDDVSEPPSPDTELVAIFRKDGMHFHRFDLALPRGMKIERPSAGTLVFDSPRVRLTLTAVYEGFSTNLPSDFAEMYLGLDDISAGLLVKCALAAELKPMSMLQRGGWDYYAWIDSFADRFQSFADEDRFFARISWDAVRTAIKVIARRDPAAKESLKPSA